MLMTFSHCVLISPRNYVCACPLGGCLALACLFVCIHRINPPILAFGPLFFCALWLFLCFYFGNIISFGPPRFHLVRFILEWCVIVHTCNCLMLRVCDCAFFSRVSLALVDSIFGSFSASYEICYFFYYDICVSVWVWTCCCLTVVIYIILNGNLVVVSLFFCTAAVIVCSCLCFISVDITH